MLSRSLKALGLVVALGFCASVNAAPAPPTYVYCCGLSGGCTYTTSASCVGTAWSTLRACATNCL
jgi:hypothetical protein